MQKLLLAGIAILALSGQASAADSPTKTGPVYKAAPAAAPAWSWAGAYIGINVGGTWGKTDIVYTPPGGPDGFIPVDVAIYGAGATRTLDRRRFTGGGQIGYNSQASNVVTGVELDFGYLGRSDSFSGSFLGVWGLQNVNITSKSGWLFTARGRLGVAINPWLFYGTAGVALTNAVSIGNNWNPALGFRDASIDTTSPRVGLVAGGGAEYALQPNMSLKLEYLHLRFEDSPSVVTAGMLNTAVNVVHHYDVTTHQHIIRAGLNYRFDNFGKGPVVAGY